MLKTFELSSSMNFLIVDENESYRIEIMNSLKKMGFREIQLSTSSLHALKLLKTTPIDLVICDRNMQVIDGAQILKEVRESFDIHGTPFLMTGALSKVTKEDLSMLAEYEIDAYLTKPFSAKNLMEKITLCLEHYRNPKNIEFNIALGKEKLKIGKVSQALTLFEELLEINPQSARIRICIARCYRDLNDLNSSFDFCMQAIEKNPQFAQSYDELGKIYLTQDKVDDAIDCFQKGIALSPRFPPRYEYIVDSLMRKHAYMQAEFVIKKAIENMVKFDDIDLKYGEILFYNGKYDKAIIYIEKGLLDQPFEKKLLNLKGICLKNLNRGEDALKHYNMALKRYPEDTKILFNKSLCLVTLEKFDQAVKVLQFILTLEPGNQKILDKLDEVNKKIVSKVLA